MNRRKFLKAMGVSAAAVAMPRMLLAGEKKYTNIIFIMADDHAASAVSAYGGFLADIAKTPNIDRLTKEGQRFDNCFCTNSICTPSRATILTGKYGHKNGCPNLDAEFDGTQQTFPKLLQKAGYYTVVVGKWHLHSEPTGFDYYNVLPGQGDYFDPNLKEKGRPWKDGFEGGEIYPGYITDVLTDIALDFLKRRPKDKPFCLLLHHKAPHDMWEYDHKHAHLYENVDIPKPSTLFDNYKSRSKAITHDKFFKIGMGDLTYDEQTGHLKGKRRKEAQYQIFIKSFLRCVASIDENVGRVLDYLDESGLFENTMVIYTSDQGAFLGEHGLWDKRWMYEESIRMPFLVRYPQKIKPGSVNSDIILNVDFAETFLDYAGVPIPQDMQGASIKPLLEGKPARHWRKSMYYHYSDEGGITPHYGVRTKRYKLIYYYGLAIPEWELFDLNKDPMEMKNVYNNSAYVGVVKKLKTELTRLRKELEDNDEVVIN
jgi:arylsulfatase A-like enzyme